MCFFIYLKSHGVCVRHIDKHYFSVVHLFVVFWFVELFVRFFHLLPPLKRSFSCFRNWNDLFGCVRFSHTHNNCPFSLGSRNSKTIFLGSSECYRRNKLIIRARFVCLRARTQGIWIYCVESFFVFESNIFPYLYAILVFRLINFLLIQNPNRYTYGVLPHSGTIKTRSLSIVRANTQDLHHLFLLHYIRKPPIK